MSWFKNIWDSEVKFNKIEGRKKDHAEVSRDSSFQRSKASEKEKWKGKLCLSKV